MACISFPLPLNWKFATDRVGIGSDWGAVTPDLPPELAEATRQAFIRAGFKCEELPEMGIFLPEVDDWTRWFHITAGLLARGFSDSEVLGLIGGHWLAFMRRSCLDRGG